MKYEEGRMNAEEGENNVSCFVNRACSSFKYLTTLPIFVIEDPLLAGNCTKR
jgi:hypothetical protein